jgi:hypothetical protein
MIILFVDKIHLNIKKNNYLLKMNIDDLFKKHRYSLFKNCNS